MTHNGWCIVKHQTNKRCFQWDPLVDVHQIFLLLNNLHLKVKVFHKWIERYPFLDQYYICIHVISNGIYVKYKWTPVFMGQVGEGCGLKYCTATKRVPGAIYRVRTLEGFWGTLPVWDQGWSPVAGNGFSAFQRAKMSCQDTQLNTISCIFIQRSN